MTERMRFLLEQLEAQLASARDHEDAMKAALAESNSWSEPQDREWIRDAAREATDHRLAAEARLHHGRRIAARGERTVARG